MANKVLGMHRLKNKVNRNAFDLSHRQLFAAGVIKRQSGFHYAPGRGLTDLKYFGIEISLKYRARFILDLLPAFPAVLKLNFQPFKLFPSLFIVHFLFLNPRALFHYTTLLGNSSGVPSGC